MAFTDILLNFMAMDGIMVFASHQSVIDSKQRRKFKEQLFLCSVNLI